MTKPAPKQSKKKRGPGRPAIVDEAFVRAVFRLIGEGKSFKQIARDLKVSLATVSTVARGHLWEEICPEIPRYPHRRGPTSEASRKGKEAAQKKRISERARARTIERIIAREWARKGKLS